MSIMLEKTYRALRTAGAPEEQATEAAAELGGMWARLLRVEIVLAFNTALQVAIFVKLFAP